MKRVVTVILLIVFLVTPVYARMSVATIGGDGAAGVPPAASAQAVVFYDGESHFTNNVGGSTITVSFADGEVFIAFQAE